MARLPHLIGRETLDIALASEAGATRWQETFARLNREALLPLIERVLDEFDHPGTVIRIDRLSLDLGIVRPADLDDLPERLAQALRLALAERLGAHGAGVLSAEDAWLGRLEAFLRQGIWPYRDAGGPAETLQALVDAAPTALVALLRRLGRRAGIVTRLAEQFPAAILERLLPLLEPEEALTILGYMAEIRAAHAVERLVAETDPALARLLWRLVLADLLHQAGSRFNRVRFVGRLVTAIAAAAGTSYAGLLDLLQRALATIAARRPVAASLPAIIATLQAEQRPVPAPAPDAGGGDALALPRFEAFLLHGDAAAAADGLLIAALAAAPKALVRLLRRQGRNERVVARLARHLGPAGLAALLGLLRPEEATFILHYIERITTLHRERPPAPRAVADFTLATRHVVLRYVLNDAGTRFNRLNFMRIVIGEAAAMTRVGYRTMLGALHRGIAELGRNQPIDRAFAGLVAELAGEQAPAAEVRRGDAPPGDLVARLRLARTTGRRPPDPMPDAAARVATSITLDAALAYLDDGLLPWTAIAALPALTPGRALFCLAGPIAASRRDRLPVALARLAGRDLVRLVLRLLPRHAHALRQAIGRGLAAAPARRAFLERLAAALLAGDAVDLEALADAIPTVAPPAPPPPLLVLAEGLSGRGAAAAPGPWARLLLRHAAQAPADVRRFLGALRTSHDPRLQRYLSAVALHRLLTLLAPAAAAPLAGLAAAIRAAELAPASPIIEAMLALGPGARPDVGTFALIFRRLLGRAPDPGRRARLRAQLVRHLPAAWHAAARAAMDRAAPPTFPHGETLLAALRGDDGQDVGRLLGELLDLRPAGLATRLRPLLADPALRRRLYRSAPAGLIARLVILLAPRDGATLGAAALLLAETRDGLDPARRHETGWRMVLDLLLDRPGRAGLGDLVDRALARGGDAEDAWRRARAAGQAALAEVLAARRRAAPVATPTEDPAPGETILVDNAGLVLLGAFLPRLFDMLGLVERGGAAKARLTDPGRAAHLLQLTADGRCDRPETLLVLNRLLCGLPLATPIPQVIEPTTAEREGCDQLLRAVIANWPPLANSSIAALQETFLQRDGLLAATRTGWTLTVQRKTVDVLIDRLPWSFSVQLHSWMEVPVHVEW